MLIIIMIAIAIFLRYMYNMYTLLVSSRYLYNLLDLHVSDYKRLVDEKKCSMTVESYKAHSNNILAITQLFGCNITLQYQLFSFIDNLISSSIKSLKMNNKGYVNG